MLTHTKGLLITTIGVLILGPDTLFLRLVDESPWMVLVWRGALVMLGFALIERWLNHTSFINQVRQLGVPELALAACFTTSSICFVNAVHFTTVANTLVIVSSAPMIAAALGAVLFKEVVSRASLLAMFMVMIGVFLVVQNQDGSNWVGDAYAFGTAIMISVTFLLSRVHQKLHRFPAMALSGLLLVLIGVFIVNPQEVQTSSLPYLLILGLITTVAFALLIVGPQYMPAHEVALMMPIETVMGVFLVWWFLGEAPSGLTLIGGILVLLTLMIYSIHSVRAK